MKQNIIFLPEQIEKFIFRHFVHSNYKLSQVRALYHAGHTTSEYSRRYMHRCRHVKKLSIMASTFGYLSAENQRIWRQNDVKKLSVKGVGCDDSVDGDGISANSTIAFFKNDNFNFSHVRHLQLYRFGDLDPETGQILPLGVLFSALPSLEYLAFLEVHLNDANYSENVAAIKDSMPPNLKGLKVEKCNEVMTKLAEEIICVYAKQLEAMCVDHWVTFSNNKCEFGNLEQLQIKEGLRGWKVSSFASVTTIKQMQMECEYNTGGMHSCIRFMLSHQLELQHLCVKGPWQFLGSAVKSIGSLKRFKSDNLCIELIGDGWKYFHDLCDIDKYCGGPPFICGVKRILENLEKCVFAFRFILKLSVESWGKQGIDCSGQVQKWIDSFLNSIGSDYCVYSEIEDKFVRVIVSNANYKGKGYTTSYLLD